MNEHRHAEWLAHYFPGVVCLLIFVAALIVPGREQYIAPFGAAGVIVLAVGAAVHRITFGRWL